MDKDQLHKVTSYGIYPAIGIARVGTSEDYFLGPEVPGIYAGFEKDFTFRDKNGKLKKQAARFRIFGYDENGAIVTELQESDDVQIVWNVQLSNTKCSFKEFKGRANFDKAEIRNKGWADRDALEAHATASVARSQKKSLDGELYRDTQRGTTKRIHLGEIIHTNDGLVVTGGHGCSGSVIRSYISNYANNDWWYDDVSDGPVTAQVTIKSKRITPKDELGRSWIVVGPPKYAPATPPIISLYTKIKETQFGTDPPAQVEFYRDVLPIFDSICKIAWVNQSAWRGHGPNKGGDFLKEVELLNNPDQQYSSRRMDILQKIRKPKELSNEWELAGQAYHYFMPPLSGDNGDTRDSDPTTFLSVSIGQYKILEKWANGDFVTGTPVEDFTVKATELKTVDIRKLVKLEDQPKALNQASLEWSAGGAFFPGIEMTFIADEKETFGNSEFRISNTFKPGDITKWMAVPWQADFYECQEHWWPSQRPDDVIPGTHNINILANRNLLSNLSSQDFVKWDRGLRTNEPTRQNVHWGDLDMVIFWNELGFVLPTQVGDTKEVIYREVERSFNTMTPQELQHQIGLNEMYSLLQLGLLIELTTIPTYLYAMYSIKDTGIGSEVRQIIHNVVIEEMLHVSLVSNLITALTDKDKKERRFPIFYAREMTPFYPNPLPCYRTESNDPLIVELAAANQDTLKLFINIEKPKQQSNKTTNKRVQEFAILAELEKNFISTVFDPDSPLKNLSFSSIGEFYSFLETLIDKKEYVGFHDADGYQLAPGMAFTPRKKADGLMVIDSKDAAKEAIRRIKVQGEGAEEPKTHTSGDKNAASHYEQFKKAEQLIIDSQKDYQLWPVLSNPTFIDYLEYPEVGKVAKAFDAVYCFLMLLLEQSWQTSQQERKRRLLVGGMPILMKGLLAPLAEYLVTLPIGNGKTAGPTFGYYNFEPNSTPKEQLIKELEIAAKSFPNSSVLNSLPTVAHQLPDIFGKPVDVLLIKH